jgi:signal transduction histidine kinase
VSIRLVTEIISEAPGPRWAPQILVLLDEESRVLDVNRSLAGKNFDAISEARHQSLHSQLHPGCDGKCRFNEMWDQAWCSLSSKDSIEWELDDPMLQRLLRLNLSKTPTPPKEEERRQRHKLLTITDITKYRREYESLVEQQQALIRLLMAKALQAEEKGDKPFDEAGDTGNRLMAGYLKTERSLSRQLILAQEKERRRIASELHDGIAQTIGVVKYGIEDSVFRLAEKHPDIDFSIFDGAVDQIQNLVEEVRRISNNLAPSILEDFGIHVALDRLCTEFKAQNRGVTVNCSVQVDESDTPELVKIAIYRVAQEALSNIAKHASATSVDAVLEAKQGGVTLSITDNGAGFDPNARQRRKRAKSGYGLRSMTERVEATGGIFTVQAAPEKGVSISAEWPKHELDLSR